jgi:DNA-binding transcriptional MerR regulator
VASDRSRPSRAGEWVTIDELAGAVGTTSRRVRSYQTLGLLPYPELQGRTGLYGPSHRDRLGAILSLQDQGFSLESLGVLFRALDAGRSLADVLGPRDAGGARRARPEAGDEAERYAFGQLQPATPASVVPRVPPLLSVVPTTVWDESRAS